MLNKYQRTIKKNVTFEGIGLHKGEKIKITFKKAFANTGIVFNDKIKNESIRIAKNKITDTVLCSTLSGNNSKIFTIEHLMSALALLGIDNIEIDVYGNEVPIVDGSAYPFIMILMEAGIEELKEKRKYLRINKPVIINKDDKILKLEPFDGFEVDFTIDFEHPFIKSTGNNHKFNAYNKNYLTDISKARTFGFLKDIEFLKEKGLVKGGSLENAIVLDEYNMMNKESLRYDNEFVRHKILDLIGDFYVDGMQILAKITSLKSGHELNNLAINSIFENSLNYSIITLDDEKIESKKKNNITILEPELSLNF